MEPPVASSQSGLAETVSRRADAIRSGLVVAIGGVPVRLQAPDPLRARVMAEFLYGLEPVAGEPGCTLTFDQATPALPARSADAPVFDGEVWQRGPEFAFRHDSGLVARADATTARIGGDAEELWWPFRRLFHPVIAHLLAHHGRYVLHAAAIASEDGTVLVFGSTGTGKSTTAMAALGAGWRVLGDDAVVVTAAADRIEVQGIARPPAVPGDVFDGTGPFGAMVGDMRKRVELPADWLSSDTEVVNGIVVTDHALTGPATIERVAAGDVLTEVLSAYTPAWNGALVRAFFPHAAALSRIPAWRLRHAQHAASRLDEAAALLADVQASVRSDRS